MKLFILALLVSACFCACPFSQRVSTQDNQLIRSCKIGEIFIDGACKFNDFKLASASNSVEVSDLLTISWKVANSKSVDFVMHLKQKSWVGMGFGDSMFDVDMVIAEIDSNNKVNIWQSLSEDEERPSHNASNQGLTLLGYDVQANSVTVKFNRLMDTGLDGFAVLELGEEQDFVAAYSDDQSPSLDYHGDNQFDFTAVIGQDSLQQEEPELDIVSTLERIFDGLF